MLTDKELREISEFVETSYSPFRCTTECELKLVGNVKRLLSTVDDLKYKVNDLESYIKRKESGMKRSCKTCKWWEEQKYDGPNVYGECHRFPPPALSLTDFKIDIDEDGMDGVGVLPRTWPGEWCGEWSTKESDDGVIPKPKPLEPEMIAESGVVPKTKPATRPVMDAAGRPFTTGSYES